ncbi:MAG: hypothetical protein Q4F66_14895, partial [Clostridium sp.]|nr:hypothetical protein [Clostridium sp.]
MLKKFILKSAILLCIITFIIYLISPILDRNWNADKMLRGMYGEDNNFDIVFLGSSHMNNSMNPDIIQEKCNLTSYNYGTGGQPISVTYHLLKEILANQPVPKMVVLDVYYLGLTDDYGEAHYISYVLDNMKFSKNKIEAIRSSVSSAEKLYYLLPFFRYHTRWSYLTEDDFNFDFSRYDYINGFDSGTEKYGYELESPSSQSSSITGEIPEKSQNYLYKIIELSQEYGFDLVFVNAPYDYTNNDWMNNWYPDDASMFNKVSEIASENNIPFINYSTLDKMKELDFDFKNDM